MGAAYYMLPLIATLCTSVISTCLYRAIFRPSGWTKKDNYGVAVRFKVFLPLYLQNPKKWKLMPDKVMYDNAMTVYFSSGHQWRKYNRWRKRAEKERIKRQQEERKQRFMDMIFQDYQTEPNPEFTPPPTVKPKTEENGEDCYIVRGGRGNPIVEVIPMPGDKLTNAERDKIQSDLMLTAQEQEKRDNPRCKDCKHMRYRHNDNGKIDTVCVMHKTVCGFEPIFPAMVACGVFEERCREFRDYRKWAAARDAILNSAKTERIPTSNHYE